jgi:uncharacterized protein YjiK
MRSIDPMIRYIPLFCVAILVNTACAEPPSVQPSTTSESARYLPDQSGEHFSSLNKDNVKQWKLPDSLREISGLALTDDERLLAVTDEEAIVFEHGDTVYLITSNGLLYTTREGNDGERVRYKKEQTGIGKNCEIEGLAWDADTQALVVACKEAKRKKLKGTVTVYRWKPGSEPPADILFQLDERTVADAYGKKKFSPSAISIDPVTGDYIILASHQQAIAKVRPDGSLIVASRLPTADRHRQPEGLALTSKRTLVIVDEGGKGRARLSTYEQFH